MAAREACDAAEPKERQVIVTVPNNSWESKVLSNVMGDEVRQDTFSKLFPQGHKGKKAGGMGKGRLTGWQLSVDKGLQRPEYCVAALSIQLKWSPRAETYLCAI